MIEQGSEAWKAQRLGKATASRMADICAQTKTGWGASRANYAAQLIVERLTGTVAESYTNAAMEWGTACEPEARAVYSFSTDATVTETGFVPHPDIEMSGASPDGLVGNDGLIEIKCPQSATQIETLLSGAVPQKYILQMQWQMACTGRKWCDFVSYDPRMPENLRLFVKRVERDDAAIRDLENKVRGFLAEVDGKVKALQDLAT
jgi:putative phage-type endonuclease